MLTEIKQQPIVLEDTMSKNQRNLGLICNQLRPLIESGRIDQVMIVARGSSDNAAILGKYLFETKTGLPVSLAALSVVNLYEAPTKSFTATIMLFYLLVAELAEERQLQQELKTTPTLMMKTLSVEREVIMPFIGWPRHGNVLF
jgi:glucosamine 6-phosphate synthetase-like amidotransferase/phosphosugar isomerase protein